MKSDESMPKIVYILIDSINVKAIGIYRYSLTSIKTEAPFALVDLHSQCFDVFESSVCQIELTTECYWILSYLPLGSGYYSHQANIR